MTKRKQQPFIFYLSNALSPLYQSGRLMTGPGITVIHIEAAAEVNGLPLLWDSAAADYIIMVRPLAAHQR